MAPTPSSSDTLRRSFEAYNTHDSEAVRRMASEDISLSRPGQSLAGREELLAAYRVDWEDFPDCRLDMTAAVSEGRRVFAEATWSATNTGSLHLPDGTVAPPTGRKVVLECAAAGEVEDGVVRRLRVYWDNLASMQQLGLIPE